MLNFTSSLLREGVLFTTKTHTRVDIAHDYVDTKCSTVYFEDLNMGFSLNRLYFMIYKTCLHSLDTLNLSFHKQKCKTLKFVISND